MPPNIPTFTVKANGPGEIYGVDIVEISGSQHLVCVDYHSCCIFGRGLRSLQSVDIIDASKSIFCDVGHQTNWSVTMPNILRLKNLLTLQWIGLSSMSPQARDSLMVMHMLRRLSALSSNYMRGAKM